MRALLEEKPDIKNAGPSRSNPFTKTEIKRHAAIVTVDYLSDLNYISLADELGRESAQRARAFINHCCRMSFVAAIVPCPARDVAFTLGRVAATWNEIPGPYAVFPRTTEGQHDSCVLIIDKDRLRLVRMLQLLLKPNSVPLYPIYAQIYSRVVTIGHDVFEFDRRNGCWEDMGSFFLDGRPLPGEDRDEAAANERRRLARGLLQARSDDRRNCYCTKRGGLDDGLVKVKIEPGTEGEQRNDNSPCAQCTKKEVMKLPIADDNTKAWSLYLLCLRMALYVSGRTFAYVIACLPRPENPGFWVLERVTDILALATADVWTMHTGVQQSFLKADGEQRTLYQILEAFLLQRSGMMSTKKRIHRKDRPRVGRAAIETAMQCIHDMNTAIDTTEHEVFETLEAILSHSVKKADPEHSTVELCGERVVYKAQKNQKDIEPPVFYWYEFCLSRVVNLKPAVRLSLLSAVTLPGGKSPPTAALPKRYLTSKTCFAQHTRNYYNKLWKDLEPEHPCFTEMAPRPGGSADAVRLISEFLRMAEYAAVVGEEKISGIKDFSGDCNVDPFKLTDAGSCYGNLPAAKRADRRSAWANAKKPTKEELENDLVRFEDFFLVCRPLKETDYYSGTVDLEDVPEWMIFEAAAQFPCPYYDATRELLNGAWRDEYPGVLGNNLMEGQNEGEVFVLNTQLLQKDGLEEFLTEVGVEERLEQEHLMKKRQREGPPRRIHQTPKKSKSETKVTI